MGRIIVSESIQISGVPFQRYWKCLHRGYGSFCWEYFVEVDEVTERERRIALLFQKEITHIITREGVNWEVRGRDLTTEQLESPLFQLLLELDWAWDEKIIPSNLHSWGDKHFATTNSLVIWFTGVVMQKCIIEEKDGRRLIKTAEVFSLNGERLESDMDRELREADVKYPAVPYLKLTDCSSGTSVCLGGSTDSLNNCINVDSEWGEDVDSIAHKYSGYSGYKWSQQRNGFIAPVNPKKFAVAEVIASDNNNLGGQDETWYALYVPGTGWLRFSDCNDLEWGKSEVWCEVKGRHIKLPKDPPFAVRKFFRKSGVAIFPDFPTQGKNWKVILAS